MKLTIKIEMDNAAFDDPQEIYRVLDQVGAVQNGNIDSFKLRDSNGNTVGTVRVTK